MNAADLLVKELREEHRDREWVDRNGLHFAWCEDQWLVLIDDYDTYVDLWGSCEKKWSPFREWEIFAWRHDRHPMGATLLFNQEPYKTQGPFMDAIHNRLIRGG